MKCIVFGCTNYQGEGQFVGALCRPCDAMVRTGKIGPSNNFIRTLYNTALLQQATLASAQVMVKELIEALEV